MKLTHKLNVENIEPIYLLIQKSHGQRNYYHYKKNLSNRTINYLFFLLTNKIGSLLGTWLTDYPHRIIFVLTEEKERKWGGGEDNQEGNIGLKMDYL